MLIARHALLPLDAARPSALLCAPSHRYQPSSQQHGSTKRRRQHSGRNKAGRHAS
jgi:hypothetical protein